MKPQIYFFGTWSGDFIAYPLDYTKDIFLDSLRKSKNVCQIVLHRKNNLLYYAYIRQLSKGNYFGICLCLDCIYNDVKFLFSVFDDVFASMVQNGEIIKIGSHINIEWTTNRLSNETVAINEYSRLIINKIGISSSSTQNLPPADFSISITDCRNISIQESQESIIEATKQYSNLYIVKENYEIERVTSAVNIINSKDIEIQDLRKIINAQSKQNSKLKEEKEKIKKQKKQYNYVISLLILAISLCAVLFHTKRKFELTCDELYESKKLIANTKNKIDSLTYNYNIAVDNKMQLSNTINQITKFQPFLFTESSFEFNTGDYKFSYYGLVSGNYNLTFRVIHSDGYIQNFSKEVHIVEGYNENSVYIDNEYNCGEYYVFEIIYKNKVIGGGRH